MGGEKRPMEIKDWSTRGFRHALRSLALKGAQKPRLAKLLACFCILNYSQSDCAPPCVKHTENWLQDTVLMGCPGETEPFACKVPLRNGFAVQNSGYNSYCVGHRHHS